MSPTHFQMIPRKINTKEKMEVGKDRGHEGGRQRGRQEGNGG
jgi:hypothetical protein